MDDAAKYQKTGQRRNWLKVSIIPVLASIITAAAMYYALSAYVMSEAEENIQNILLSHRAVHQYIQKVMHPTFFRDRDKGEIPQEYYTPEIFSSSFFVRVMHTFHNEERRKAGLSEVYYKLASNNPRNSLNQADEFEKDLIKRFNEERNLKEYRSIIKKNGKEYLYFAIPFLETSQACIRCHGKRSDAPSGLQRIYSGSGGFNEQPGRIRAIESIRAPINNEKFALTIATSSSLVFVIAGLALFFYNRKLIYDVTDQTVNLEKEINDRVKAQEHLKEREESYRTLAELTSDYVHKCSRAGNAPFRVQWMGGAVQSISGYNEEEIFAHGCWLPLVHPDDRQDVASFLFSLLPGDRKNIEFRMVTKQRDVRWISETSICTAGKNDGELLLFGSANDITERKLAEDELRDSKKYISQLLEATDQGIYGIDLNGNCTFINKAGLIDLGYQHDECIGINMHDLIHHSHSNGLPYPEEECPISCAKETGVGYRIDNEVLWRKDGTSFHAEYSSYPIMENGEIQGAVVTFTDITARVLAEDERTKLESQLLQAQKMEAVGRLAGGVAHDFNNMLGVILGYAELGLMRADESNPLNANLVEIRNAAERSADLTRQLLAFARKQTISPKMIDLNETISGLLKMLQRIIGEDIHLNWHPAPDLWMVNMDSSQIDQILANLCVNARDAIPSNGKITIETDNKYLDHNYCTQHEGCSVGDYIQLTVSDNGHGMDKETLANIFEPFFTTKGIGEGTGLGLATVYGIVKQNKGIINVFSEPGSGTSFTIYLPRHTGKDNKAQVSGATTTIPIGQERILLVEDELAIMNMIAMILSNLGYKIYSAKTPTEAMQIAEEHSGEIHLLITDVVMPEMNGRDLAHKLQSRYPKLRCLFMSGYTANVIAHHGVLDEDVHFIQKPFSLPGIATKVREVLDNKE